MNRKSRNLRILLISADALFLEGLQEILDATEDFTVVSETSVSITAKDPKEITDPDIVLLDMELAAVPVELRKLPDCIRSAAVVVLADKLPPAEVAEALRCGVHAIFPKDSPVTMLHRCVCYVADGGYWIGKQGFSGQRLALESIRHPGTLGALPGYRLTVRELEIIGSVVSGLTNKQISKVHSISEDTVKHHLSNIFDKAGVYNRLELALFMVHHGIVGRGMIMAKGKREEESLPQKASIAG